MVVQAKSKFLPDLFPEMETEPKALRCLLRTDTCFVVFNRVGSKNFCVEWVGGILDCVANCIVIYSLHCHIYILKVWVGCIWLE